MSSPAVNVWPNMSLPIVPSVPGVLKQNFRCLEKTKGEDIEEDF